MGILIKKIKYYFLSNKKVFICIFGILFLFFIFFDYSFAEETPPPKKADVNDIVNTFNALFKVISVILTLGTNIVGWFLSSDWVTGRVLGIDSALRIMWGFVSNIVYISFALIIVWLAFMNIIGKGNDTYQLKQAIPRFIIGILIVPFTWFFVSAVISLSTWLTVSVLSMGFTPEIYKQADASPENFKVKYCSEGRLINTGDNTTKKAGEEGEKGTNNFTVDCKGKVEYKPLRDVFIGDGIYSIMYFYSYNVMKVQEIDRINTGDTSEVNSFFSIILKFGFSIIFILVYALILMALGIALMVRAIRFWIYAMFSPLFGLLYFFKKDTLAGVKNFGFKPFFQLAMVPVLVSGALVFGIVFIIIADSGIAKSGIIKSDSKDDCINLLPSSNSKSTQICWKGAYLDAKVKDSEGYKGFVGNFGRLLLQIFGIVFLWMGVMAALKYSEITGEIIDPIEKIGSNIGQFVKDLPTMAPIIPGPGGPVSMRALSQTSQIPSSIMAGNAAKQSNELAKQLGLTEEGSSNPVGLQADINALSSSDIGSKIGDISGRVLDIIESEGIASPNSTNTIKVLGNKLTDPSNIRTVESLLNAPGKDGKEQIKQASGNIGNWDEIISGKKGPEAQAKGMLALIASLKYNKTGFKAANFNPIYDNSKKASNDVSSRLNGL